MTREFNVTGSCNPEWHYMVDTSKRFQAIAELIDKGKYFTINRARQFGKTTTLDMIWRRMSDRYVVVPLSFEGVDDTVFESHAAFVRSFTKQMARQLAELGKGEAHAELWRDGAVETLDDLSDLVTRYCRTCRKPVVVTIDEVDKNCASQLFLNFLGMLRGKYLERSRMGMNSTFHSVVLAGVYDVKNLKLRLRPDTEKKYNSPWNIAADFTVDMTFHPDEIAQMLGDYEADHHTGMNTETISHEIYKYTNGYPFLVSYICKTIDEQLDRSWQPESIVDAVKRLVQGGSTLMDDLSKNLENNPEFREFMFSVAVNGNTYPYSLLNPMVNMGNMFSYIRNEGGHVAIHNLVFEEAIFLYFTIDYAIKNNQQLAPFQLGYVVNGHLKMEHVVERFRDLIREEYRQSDEFFLERQGRLLFLTFLKPVINGTGFYYVEPQTRDNRRMDLVVTYGKEEFIIELKIWHGTKYEQSGRDQLADYLASRGIEQGYLITFDFSKEKHDAAPGWIEHGGKRIYEAII